MKKTIITMLTAALLLSCTACGQQADKPSQTQPAVSEAAESEAASGSEDTETEEIVDTEIISEAPTTSGIGDESMGGAYMSAFIASPTTDAEAMADELIALNIIDTELVKMEVSEGYLNGFKEEITGFSKGYMFSPMIGSIPFVGYVFETDDVPTLITALNASADPAWNICTEADETVSADREKLVFFLMCSNEE